MPYNYPFINADESTKQAVWKKGRVIYGYDQATWRYDAYGSVICYADHGDTTSKWGWEIDHILPVSRGGTDDLTNLQPLHWGNNREKRDAYPWSGP
jgi:hypothetical protein